MTQQDFLNSVVINIGLLVPCCLMAFVLGMMGARHGQDSRRYLGTAFISFPVMIAGLIGFSAYAEIGSLVDARAAPALLAGVLGGVPAAMSTALVGAAMRYWQGGPFVLAGVMAVMTLCATGVLLRVVFVRQLWTWTRGLALLGMCGAVVTMPSHFIAVPFEMGMESFRGLSPLLTVIDILGVLVLGLSFWAGFGVEKAWQRMSLLQSAISSMKNGVVIAEVEPELKTVFANPAIIQISGHELRDVLGQSPYLLLKGAGGPARTGPSAARGGSA